MKTLLIVDDEPKICRLLSGFFSSRGFTAATAQSGREALSRLEESVPDYLLLDIAMPDMSGLELLREAKTRYPDLKVVMVTALDDEETKAEALRAGALDYVTKPFTFTDQGWARAFFSPL
jgi:DNA-binding response OmpR family regulator